VWGALGAAAAVIIVVIALNVVPSDKSRVPEMANVTPAKTQSPSATQQPPSIPAPRVGNSVTVAHRRPTVRHESPNSAHVVAAAVTPAATPKQPQFPTPAPLSEQERLLLAYVRNTPAQEIQTVIAQREAFQRHVNSLGVPEEQEKDER